MDRDRRQRIARQHVETDRLLGVDAVPVGRLVEPSPANPNQTVSPEPHPQASSAGDHSSEKAASPLSTPSQPAAPPPAQADAPQLSVLFSPPQREQAPAMDRAAKLSILEAIDAGEVRGCTKCELCRGRTQTVFGEGDADADLMFIGEGPGQSEDEQGRPFVGRAGELLNKMITAMGLKREQVYIANVVKCRPPNNRTPTPAEVDACWDYLRRQIRTIQPRVIVTLGGPATKMILQTREGITRIRGTWHQYDDPTFGGPPVPVMPTFHPAYLLRSYTMDNRKKVWSDLLAVMERLKQEG
jgi:uracil-DNA glycosylase